MADEEKEERTIQRQESFDYDAWATYFTLHRQASVLTLPEYKLPPPYTPLDDVAVPAMAHIRDGSVIITIPEMMHEGDVDDIQSMNTATDVSIILQNTYTRYVSFSIPETIHAGNGHVDLSINNDTDLKKIPPVAYSRDDNTIYSIDRARDALSATDTTLARDIDATDSMNHKVR